MEHASHAVCGDVEAKDFLSISRDNPFRDAEIYGESGEILISPNLGKVEVPQWITAPTTHNGHIHVGGSHQAFIESASEHKWLDITTDWFVNHYNNVPAQIAFFDYWLKDIDSELMQRHRCTCAYVRAEALTTIATRKNGPSPVPSTPAFISMHLPRTGATAAVTT